MRQRKYNRATKKNPKKRLFWCDCDWNHVGQRGKCSVCGYSAKRAGKYPKPGPVARI